MGNVCFSKPIEDFASAPLYRHLIFELFFQKYQKLKRVCLDKFAIINKVKKKKNAENMLEYLLKHGFFGINPSPVFYFYLESPFL